MATAFSPPRKLANSGAQWHIAAVIELTNDVHANVARFNQEEAVWRCFEQKRRQAKRRFRPRTKRGRTFFDRLDWAAAERAMRRSDCVGRPLL